MVAAGDDIEQVDGGRLVRSRRELNGELTLAAERDGGLTRITFEVRNTGLAGILDATISIDTKQIFKPSPDAYSLIEPRLGVKPSDVLFVSSNPWDAIGAKSVGLKVAWIERVTPEAMQEACMKSDLITPLTMFRALRTQMDELDLEPDS